MFAQAEIPLMRLRLRPDLVVSCQCSGGRRSWILKDPISLRYYTFRAEEFAVLEMLDGAAKLDELRDRFERLFAPRRMTTSRLQGFLANLYRNGLLVSDDPGQATLLLERDETRQRRERWQGWSNLLAVRFRGIDPEPLLAWLYPKVRWCFSPVFLTACAVLVLSALLLMFVEFQEFRSQLPTLADFVSARNVLWLAVAIAVTKVLHELAHALTCKHFGGECHEMGLMLLVFTPCLYCNVTDSWLLGSRWQRIAISAAGILAEVGLASLATIGWWITQPGLLHTICVNTILVCGVGTLMFNGNPLLRYDGYFILSDLLEKPNLWQESRSLINRTLAKWVLGLNTDTHLIPGDQPRLLTVYGLASTAYRAFVIVAILLFLYRWLAPLGLGLIAQLITASIVAGALAAWLPAIAQHSRDPTFWRRAKPARLVLSLVILIGLAGVFSLLPLPSSVRAPALVHPEGAQRVYVSTPGTLIRSVAAGERVEASQTLAQLEDFELSRHVAQLAGEEQRARTRVKHLELRSVTDADAAAELVIAREMWVDTAEQLKQRRKEEDGLTLQAPAAGSVIPPSSIRDARANRRDLAAWLGTPLEPSNARCYLDRGTLLCLIGDPKRREAILFVDETEVEFVRRGQRVRMHFDIGPAVVLTGTVAEIAQGDVEFVPPELAVGKELASRADATGNRRPLRTAYQVRVTFDRRLAAPIILGARGRAKIEVEPQTLSERLLRAIRRALTVEI